MNKREREKEIESRTDGVVRKERKTLADRCIKKKKRMKCSKKGSMSLNAIWTVAAGHEGSARLQSTFDMLLNAFRSHSFRSKSCTKTPKEVSSAELVVLSLSIKVLYEVNGDYSKTIFNT